MQTNFLIKYLILFLVLNVWTISAQQDTIPEYKDKGPIISIECSCDEGKFRKNKLVRSIIPDYPECPYSERTEYFDTSGNMVRAEMSWLLRDEKFTSTEYIYYLNEGNTITKTYEFNAKGDTVEYSIKYTYTSSGFNSIDSTYENGELDYIYTVGYDSITQIRTMEYQSQTWDWGSKTTFWYNEQDELYLITDEPSGNNKRNETIFVLRYENLTTYKIVHDKDTFAIRNVWLNERGLTQAFTYEEKSDEGKLKYNNNYEYLYDDHGNWIEQHYFSNGKLVAIERRKIIYYSE